MGGWYYKAASTNVCICSCTHSSKHCLPTYPLPFPYPWPASHPCRIEEAVGDEMQPILRPVIRLPDNQDTLLTRIEPDKPHSSMVFKLRWAGG